MMMILPSKKGMEEDDVPKISFQVVLKFKLKLLKTSVLLLTPVPILCPANI